MIGPCLQWGATDRPSRAAGGAQGIPATVGQHQVKRDSGSCWLIRDLAGLSLQGCRCKAVVAEAVVVCVGCPCRAVVVCAGCLRWLSALAVCAG